MSLLVVLAVLTQASDPKPARVPLPSKPSAVAAGAQAADVKPALPRPQEVGVPDAALLPRPDPTALDRWSDGATRRFVGSLIGGAVGAALPLVSGALAAGACPPTAPCPAWQLVGGLAAPVLAILGASLGSAVMGGEPSVGAAAAGIIGGLALAAVILFADLALSFSPGTAPRWPIVAGASAAAVGLSVLAMESRHEALEKAPFLVAPSVRVAATSLALLGTLAVETLVVFGLASGGRISSAGAGIAVTVLVVAGLGATPLVPIAVHRALGGRGSFGAGYLGWAASVAIGGIALLGFSVTQFSPSTNDPRLIGLLAISLASGALALALGVPLFLEWSHGNALLEESEKAPAVKAQLSVAPVAGPTGLSGGALALSGTF